MGTVHVNIRNQARRLDVLAAEHLQKQSPVSTGKEAKNCQEPFWAW